MTVVGQVAALWRYPVKSMQGEMLDATPVGDAGVLGDRAYAIQDIETGRIVSAKHPRRWANVFACRAVYESAPRPGEPLPPVEITLPGGALISSADPGVDERLSSVFGRPVRLVAARAGGPERAYDADRSPLERLGSGEVVRREVLAAAALPGLFFDYAPLHLLSTATLAALAAAYRAGHFDVRRFRPNVVVESVRDQDGFVENAWLGHALGIGTDVRLAVIDPCPRCVMTTLAQGTLSADPRILRTIHGANAAASVTAAPGVLFAAVAGVYARADQGGMIRCGDAVTLDGAYAAGAGGRRI